jgi:hypothetical protein
MKQKTIFSSLILALAALTALAQQPQRQNPPAPPQAPEGATVHRDLPYVTNGHERQKLDLYLPKEGGNLPLII